MSQKYYTLLTTKGAALLAEATALGTQLKLTHMAVGDGNGSIPQPLATQTKLVNEIRRAAINTLFVDENNKNQIIAEQIIPETEGGWFIHEIGLFDDKGNLISVGNCPSTYKPQLVEGSGRTQVIRMIIIIDNVESVEIKIDPSVVLATRQYVDELISSKIGRLLNIITFNESGQYIPSNGTKFIIVEAVGGGGAGGGAKTTTNGRYSVGSGGGAGGYAKSIIQRSEIGSSVKIIIGAGGNGVQGGNGGNGGMTKFGNIMFTDGGSGGVICQPNEIPFVSNSVTGGTVTGGNIISTSGCVGDYGFGYASKLTRSGNGGTSSLNKECGGGTVVQKNGNAASGYGCGGGGANTTGNISSYCGGNGYQGVIIVWEYA